MGKLEVDIYCNNNAILEVSSKEARFHYDERNIKIETFYPVQEIGLENFFHLQTFIVEENHYMEMKWNKKSKLFSASLWEFKENKTPNKLLFLREDFSFFAIFKALEEDLVMQQCRGLDSKLKNRLQRNDRFLISGTPKINGVYIYEGAQLKCILETEFNMEDYLLSNGCSSLFQAILSGRILEIRLENQQFLLELFSLVRSNYSGPFERKIENNLQGERLLSSLKKMDKYLEEEATLSRKLKY